MHEKADMELLREFALQNSQEAFNTLVARHVNLVYSAALRKTANPAASEEIAQAVFTILAQKAEHLPKETILSGWLYQTARLTASNFLRAETRRLHREQEAYMESLSDPALSETWNEIAPLLEDAMGRLNEKDRNALVLRFFEGKNFQEVGTALGGSENAAKKRVARALDQMRKFFSKRGIASTTAIIATVVSAHAVQAAPVGLSQSISAVAVTKGAAVSGSTLTLVKGVLKIMAWTKAKIAIVAGVSLLLAVGTTTVVVVKKLLPPAVMDESLWQANSDNLRKAPPLLIVRPTKYPHAGGSSVGMNDHWLGVDQSIQNLISEAYGHFESRTIFPTGMPRENFDVLINLPGDGKAAFRAELKKRFGIAAHHEAQETAIMVLTVKNRTAKNLKPHPGSLSNSSSARSGSGVFSCVNQPISNLANFLENYLHTPVLDRTALKGNFDIDLRWRETDWSHPDHTAMMQALIDQLGLELAPNRETIDMVVVERVDN